MSLFTAYQLMVYSLRDNAALTITLVCFGSSEHYGEVDNLYLTLSHGCKQARVPAYLPCDSLHCYPTDMVWETRGLAQPVHRQVPRKYSFTLTR